MVVSYKRKKNAAPEVVSKRKGTRASRHSVTDPESLPCLDMAYAEFLRMFPSFLETLVVDEIREEEFANLRSRVCLDYSGFGLFSYRQRSDGAASSFFRQAYVSASLSIQALYGARDEDSVETCIRRRIMDYLRISEEDYSMVFTTSKLTAVTLLAESYRFDKGSRLLLAYDHHSQAVEQLVQCAASKGAKVSSALFRWPSLKICSKQLCKQLLDKKKAKKSDAAKGLFVFPPESRVTGMKHSYQWIHLAKQNQWHVLLDASAIGPRDMDALGVSVFSPDFIVSSFYKVFGADPTGFGCLFVKKTSMQALYASSKARGMIRLLPDEEAVAEGSVQSYVVESSFSGPLSMSDLRDRSGTFLQGSVQEEDMSSGTESVLSRTDEAEAVHKKAVISQSTDVKGKEKVVEIFYPGPSYTANTDSSTEEEFFTSLPGHGTATEGESSTSAENEVIRDQGKNLIASEQAGTSETLKDARVAEISEMGAATHKEDVTALATHNEDVTQEAEASKPYSLRELLELSDEEYVTGTTRETYSYQYTAGVVCRGLDQAGMLAMSKSRNRLRNLVNWLVASLLQLRHPSGSKVPLVQVYGHRRKRGVSVAFNLCDWTGSQLDPALVHKLADRNNISLGIGVVRNVTLPSMASPRVSSCSNSSVQAGSVEFVVVTATLGFVTGFEEVYKLWMFVAKFLDADFVKKEVWRYHSLNQAEIVVY